jgi:hypothetical protein
MKPNTTDTKNKRPSAKVALARAQAIKINTAKLKGDCLAEAAELQEAVLHLLRATGKWGARKFAEDFSYLPDAIREMQPPEMRGGAA